MARTGDVLGFAVEDEGVRGEGGGAGGRGMSTEVLLGEGHGEGGVGGEVEGGVTFAPVSEGDLLEGIMWKSKEELKRLRGKGGRT